MKQLLTVCAALALAACSPQPGADRQEVASLSTPGSAAPTSTAPKEERPRERLDMTPEDRMALRAPYVQCLAGHGVDKKSAPQPKELTDKAEKACEPKKPLPPWENDASNPEALDFANRVVQCLRGKGVRYVEVHSEPGSGFVGQSYGGPNNDQESITLGLQHTRECEIEASKK